MIDQPNNSHYKPTPEELEAENQRLLAEAEALADKEEIEDEEQEEETAPAVEEVADGSLTAQDEVKEPEKPQDEEETKPTEDKEEVEEPKEDEAPAHDWEKRYKDSTSEAQRLYKNNSIMNKAISEANELPDPTEEELKTEYGADWDLYDNAEKRIYKEMFVNKRFRANINEASKEIRNIEAWNDKVAKFVEDPQTLLSYPELDSKTKTEQFKIYASDRSVQGTNMEVLANSFLHELSKSEKPKNKGQMFETGKGGPNDKPKPTANKLSITDSAKLAKTNYKLYVDYLRAGKISNEIE